MNFIENHRNGLFEFKIQNKSSPWPSIISLTLLLISRSIYLIPFTLILISFSIPIQESVLLMPDLGIQQSKQTILKTTTKFIPIQEIDNIMIIEGIHHFQVKYFLALLIKNEPKLVVLFPESRPRLHLLERIFYHANVVLNKT